MTKINYTEKGIIIISESEKFLISPNALKSIFIKLLAEHTSMKINGFEYTESEVLEALRKKGYTILPYRTYTETPIHGSSFTKDWYDTKCAVKTDQLPSDENIWHNVAIKEFQKEFIKPKLL